MEKFIVILYISANFCYTLRTAVIGNEGKHEDRKEMWHVTFTS